MIGKYKKNLEIHYNSFLEKCKKENDSKSDKSSCDSEDEKPKKVNKIKSLMMKYDIVNK